MSGNNSTLGIAGRRSNSPDLWIPYILIGVACVTFLAVHFWCYHKRNRERYLRKRDEKRVKSGLMERRRITTLMLARYQSDLGLTKRERDIDTTGLFYDNTVDVIIDETEEYFGIGTGKPEHFLNSAKKANEMMIVPINKATVGLGNLSSKKPRTIATSQTWPLSTERKSVPYNAHETCGNETNDSNEDSGITFEVTSGADKNKNPTSREQYTEVTSKTFVVSNGTNKYTNNITSLQTIPEVNFSTQKGNDPRAVVFRTFSSPSSYPRVIYTNRNASSNFTHSSLLSAFKPQHKKRRHDVSSLIDFEQDSFDINDCMGVRLDEISKIHQSEKRCIDSTSVYNTGHHGNCYNIMSNEQNYSKHLDNPGCIFSEAEVLPFADVCLAYGSFNKNPDSENVQMPPLNKLNHKNIIEQTSNRELPCASTIPSNKDGIAKEISSVSSTRIDPTSSYKPTDQISTHFSNRLPHSNIIISFAEKSPLNLVSKNPAKVRTKLAENTPTKFWLPRERTKVSAKVDSVDNQDRLPEHCLLHCGNPDCSTSANPASSSQPTETTLLTHDTDEHSFSEHHSDRTESGVYFVSGESTSLFNDNYQPRTVENISSTVSNYELSSSLARDTKRSIVFHSTKRKFGIKSD